MTCISAAAASRSTHALNAFGDSTAMPLSGRHAGSTRTRNDASAAMALWCSRLSVGSSVVQTTSTFIRRRMARQENSGRASFALHSSQMPFAVRGFSRRSPMPKMRWSSRCVQ